MVNEYYQAFLNTLPDETREDVAAILGVGNLTIEKRLEYLEEYLKEKELKTCKKLMQLEEPTSSTESDEGSEEDEVDLVAKLQQELNERDETISQLRKDLSENLTMTAEHLVKIAALEKAQLSEQEAGEISKQQKEREEKFDQERKRNGELTGENEKLQKEVKELKRMVDIEREAASQLLASKNEDSPWKEKSSPFPFLDGETPAAVQVPHSAIEKYTKGEAVEAANALCFFLPKGKRIAYQKWKEELMEGLPTALFALPEEKKLQITAYYKENYTPKPERRHRSLEDIMEIAHKMLESFKEMKKMEISKKPLLFTFLKSIFSGNFTSFPIKLLTMFEGSKSPFPFLKEENDETIKEVHRIICNLVSHPEKVDQAMNVFLSEENKKKYEIFKEELKRETPMELAVLPTEWRLRIYAWIDRRFYPKPAEQVKDNSLEDILKIAKEMLEHFEKCKKTSPAIDYPEENEIEEGFVSMTNETEKENHRSVSTVNTESYEKVEDNECGGKDEKQAAPPPSPPESDEPAVTDDNVNECPDDEPEAEQPNGTNGTPPALQPRENSGTVTFPIPLSSSTTQVKVDQNKEKPPQRTDPKYWKEVNDQAQAARLEEPKEHNAQRVTNMMGEGYNPKSASNSLVPTEQSSDYSAYENSLNVMLIGETGVGKTTFINGFQNYLNYASLDEALAGEPIVPVRTSFDMIVEKDSKPIDITIEPPYNAAEWMNEPLFTENGQSRTQNAMIHNFCYTFNGAERIIRLVDTPGVMDTRGDEKDKENYYNTVEVIKQLKQIHAICVLLKPNEARLTQEFSHALDFLLLYLPQTAVQNLVFCFTSTEPFNFLPSQTLLVLEDYLKSLKTFTNISVSATKENIFCFDNNCFRFQCTVKQRPDHISKKHDYETSWNNNTKQLTRMLGYIQTLTPYSTADSVNIARVEKRLRNLVDTFVDITKEHAKELINLKARNSLWSKDGESDDRERSFKYILKCCCYFTDYLRRTSIGIEDVFGIKLEKLIMNEEKNYKLVKSAESRELIPRLQKIATDYKTRINTLRHEKRGKATTEEIEQILHVAGQVNYYGGRIAAIDGQYQKKESFREKPVKC